MKEAEIKLKSYLKEIGFNVDKVHLKWTTTSVSQREKRIKSILNKINN